MENLSFRQVDLTQGFWKNKQDMNRKVTIYSVWERFKETGRFEAFHFNWKDGMPNQPHIFWDSDIAKWIEGVSYILEKEPDGQLENAVDEIVECIEKYQDANGYFNIYFTVCHPEQRFQKRTEHELYCAGHLMEAAVAYYYATKKERFLKTMCRYADYIERVFVTDKSAAFVTPGHEEIELALVKLYQCTSEARYLELAKFFVDQRGLRDENGLESNTEGIPQYYDFANRSYCQSHLPVREQTTAEGHSVRGCYLYSAMADLAKLCKDETLLSACKNIFDNITQKRMYITGGIGSSHVGEAFTINYDLPNKNAYAETCAAISLILFAQRLLGIEAKSLYADIVERVLYNGMLSGISLDGNAFFYENPLEIDPSLINKDASIVKSHRTRFCITQRVEVFDCSCCPPNLNRIFASIGDYIYGVDNDTYFIHQFMSSTYKNKAVQITQTTNYPSDGRVTIKTSSVSRLAIRIPDWCIEYTISAEYSLKDGYAYIDNITENIVVNFVMNPVLIQASPYVQENAGRVALQCGPVVYCLEAVDNGPYLRNVYVDSNLITKVAYDEWIGTAVITAAGYRPEKTERLYSQWNNKLEPVKLKFIPYYAFANRGESEMLIWCNVK